MHQIKGIKRTSSFRFPEEKKNTDSGFIWENVIKPSSKGSPKTLDVSFSHSWIISVVVVKWLSFFAEESLCLPLTCCVRGHIVSWLQSLIPCPTDREDTVSGPFNNSPVANILLSLSFSCLWWDTTRTSDSMWWNISRASNKPLSSCFASQEGIIFVRRLRYTADKQTTKQTTKQKEEGISSTGKTGMPGITTILHYTDTSTGSM